MPRRQAPTGGDKAAGIQEFVRIRGNGDAVLTSKNESDNPSFTRFKTTGEPDGMTLNTPIEETHFSPYVLGPGQTVQTRQATVPLQEGVWEARQPLVVGNTPPDPAAQSRVSSYALPPILEAVVNTRVGYEAGWRGITYGYAILARGGGNTYLWTDCAPLTTLNLAQGQGFRINWGINISEAITFLVIGMTPAYVTEIEAANSTTVYVQEFISTRPRIPAVTDMYGPFKTGATMSFLSSGNKTFITGTLAKPSTSTSSGGRSKWKPQLAYSFETAFGRSLSSTVNVKSNEKKRVTWWPPSIPPQATAWYPEYVDSEGNWRAFVKWPLNTRADLKDNVPEKTAETRKIEWDRNTDDNKSGVDGPDSALSSVTAIGASTPTDGIFRVRLTKSGVDTLTGREEESPTSPEAATAVSPGFILKVTPQGSSQNLFENAEALRVTNAASKTPDAWTRANPAGVTYDDIATDGIQTFTDTSASISVEDVITSPGAWLVSKPDAVIGGTVTLTRTTGQVDVLVYQYNTDGTSTTFTVRSLNASGTYRIKVRLSATGTSAAQANDYAYGRVVYNAGVQSVHLLIRHNGTASGVRNMTSSIRNFGAFLGKAFPRKRSPVDPVRLTESKYRYASLDTEPPTQPYIGYGYNMVVINPANDQRPYNTDGVSLVPGNMIEYFASYGTPTTTAYFLSDFKFSVKPGEQRSISAYLYWEGVDNAATPLKLVERNAQGEIVADHGGFSTATDITGDSRDAGGDAHGWIRAQMAIITGDDTVTIEMSSGGVGDGFFRVMGIQNEVGAQATEFVDDYYPQGSLISTFDMSIPGVPTNTRELATLAPITRIIGIGSEVTHEFNPSGDALTSHLTLARARYHDDTEYGPWTEDPEQLFVFGEGNYYVQVATVLATSDLDYSPVLHNHYIDFERNPIGSNNGVVTGSFCRADGSEFDGTAQVYNFPSPREQRTITTATLASGRQDFGTLGEAVTWLRGLGIECYTESTAREIMQLVGEGIGDTEDDNDQFASTFTAWIQGKIYRIRILDLALTANRESYMPIEDMEYEGRFLFNAEDVEAEIIDEDDMDV